MLINEFQIQKFLDFNEIQSESDYLIEDFSIDNEEQTNPTEAKI